MSKVKAMKGVRREDRVRADVVDVDALAKSLCFFVADDGEKVEWFRPIVGGRVSIVLWREDGGVVNVSKCTRRAGEEDGPWFGHAWGERVGSEWVFTDAKGREESFGDWDSMMRRVLRFADRCRF